MGILACIQIDSDRLVRLRNPWGEGADQNGRILTPDFKIARKLREKAVLELQRQRKEVRAQDFLDDHEGSFWMQWTDVLKYFSEIAVCKMHSDWNESGETFNLNSSSNVGFSGVRAEAFATTLLETTLHQQSSRGQSLSFNLADLSIAIVQVPKNGWKDRKKWKLMNSSKRQVNASTECESMLDFERGGDYL